MRTLFIVVFSTVAFAQQAVSVGSVTVSADGVAALNTFLATRITASPTTLNGAITAAATSITFTDATNIPANAEIAIDGEAIQTTGTGNTRTVVRGDFGTTAAAHLDKAQVSVLQYRSIRQLFLSDLNQLVGRIMETSGSPTVATQNNVISTAQAAIAAAKAAAVQ